MPYANALYTCQHCSGPAFGAFCSYRCWRIANGLPIDETDLANRKTISWKPETIEAHAAAPTIYAERSTPKGLVALPTPATADQVETLPEAAATVDQVATFHQVEQAKPLCIACGDTGRNSKGGLCYPCVRAGRVSAEPSPEYSQPINQVEAIELPPAIAPTNQFTRPAKAGQMSLF